MTLDPEWKKVTVVGCGLIGASFALAIKRAHLAEHVAGWDVHSTTLDEALQRGIIDEVDEGFSSGSSLRSSHLVYLAMPVSQIIHFLKTHGRNFSSGTVVTDAGSTKAEVCRAAENYVAQGSHFIGGHPIAGSHLRGLAHAREDLFENAPYVLTVRKNEDEGSVITRLARTLEAIGARVAVMEAEEHDRVMALVSHLPQLLSSALAGIVNEHEEREALLGLAGTGYRDMTRLSASAWSVWQDILMTNKTAIADAIDLYLHTLTRVRDELRAGTLNEDSTTSLLFKSAQTTCGTST